MTLRQWYFGIAVAAISAALAPAGAYADSVMNLPASPNFYPNPNNSVGLDFQGVTAETNYTVQVNGGSCSVAGGAGTCSETTYGAGVINDVYNNFTTSNLWGPGTVSPSNPSGYSIGFVIYGIADASVTSVTTNGITTESIDNTGANAATGSDGKIHIDLYYMSPGNAPCFNAGCTNLITASDVAGVTSTVNSNVFKSASLFAAFTLESGVVPLNTADDGTSNGNVTLTQTFTLNNSKGTGNFYATCNSGPGCSDFQAVKESFLDSTGTGYSGDSTYADLLAYVFGELNTTAATGISGGSCNGTLECGAGWGLTVKDPVFAVAVPEPGSLALLGSALIIFGGIYRRRRKGTPA